MSGSAGWHSTPRVARGGSAVRRGTQPVRTSARRKPARATSAALREGAGDGDGVAVGAGVADGADGAGGTDVLGAAGLGDEVAGGGADTLGVTDAEQPARMPVTAIA